MNDAASTKTLLDNMFNNGSGFTDSSLDGSKKCGNKTAASPIASATVKPLFDSWITEFTEVRQLLTAVLLLPVLLDLTQNLMVQELSK